MYSTLNFELEKCCFKERIKRGFLTSAIISKLLFYLSDSVHILKVLHLRDFGIEFLPCPCSYPHIYKYTK